MLVKASGITNLTDARYFAAREVHFLGFNLEEGTEGFIDPVFMKAIREWVEGPKIVGEFDRTPAGAVREAAEFYGLNAVQVTLAQELAPLEGLDVILHVPGAAAPALLRPLLQARAPWVSWFLIDFSHLDNAGAQLLAQAPVWSALFADFPALLALDAPAAALPELLTALHPAGLALRGGAEERVGVKSFEEIDAVFEELGR
ncbi:MAG: hypothetical protein IPH12_22310 [Saprospirales bacterium]|jgi:phosphoribosylanthranilate isomerase|nr:hypothetical protein [Saprospirales bacterium]MBK8920443.1 hypothetical protein [Saprospirales bacterium]